MLVRVGARPTRIAQHTPFTDADARLVGLEVLLLEEAHVVGRHQWRATAFGEGDGGMQMLFVVDPAGALNLQVEALGEDFAPFGQQRIRQALLAIEQRLTDLPFLGTRQGDQAVGGLLDPVALDDHQIVALPLGPAAGHQLGEVAIALAIHRQQRQSAQRTVLVAAGQPDVGAADRLDASTLRRLVELDQRAHVALIGDGHRRHARGRHLLDQWLDAHQAIDQ